jgi:16S rRNA (cytosine967-C5)-methyltransferase
VNGLLRNIARNKEKIEYPDPKKDKVRYTSVKYSMPEWIVELWSKEYGEEKTELMLEALQKEHPVVVRSSENLSEEQKKEWLLSLSDGGVEWMQHPYLPNAYLLKDTEGIAGLSGYEEGYFTVQDVSSMLAVEAAGICQIVEKNNLHKGQETGNLLVLDVCAAPGGKSVYAGQLLSQKGKVIARDLTEYKVSLIEENIERMKCANVEAEVWDALNFDDALKEKADIVLADLPCSGLGIMGKKRDIRYRSNPGKLKELEELQRQILSVIWQYVKPGGVLLYSTCTINPGENENMVKWFTKEYPFEPESLLPYLPEQFGQGSREQTVGNQAPEDMPFGNGPESGCLQLIPGIHETDGFFFARLRRR